VVTLILREWSITPNQAEVQAGKIRFVVTNDSEGMHNLKIRNAQGQTLGGTTEFLRSEGPQIFELDLQPGTYTTFCSLPGHESAGQRGTLIVK
jgi:uncharacterized cupredoxin-like copper-binding protein